MDSNPMEAGPVAVAMEEMMMEPSEEFPILFGLLTENRKKDQSSASPSHHHLMGSRPHRRRAPVCASHHPRGRKAGNRTSIVEPDSSTPDDPSDFPQEQFLQYQNQNSISASPLLILRLTSKDTLPPDYRKTHEGPTARNASRSPPALEQLQVIQRRPQRRHTSNRVISNDDDCTPSSTTADDDANPFKRTCYSLPRSFSDEIPSSTTTSTAIQSCSSSSGSSSFLTSSFEASNVQGNVTACRYPILNRRLSHNPGQDTHGASHQGGEFNALPPARSFQSDSSSSSSVFFDHGKEDPQVYACSHCHLKFKRQFHLLRHVAIHEDKRNFRCSNCSTAFYQHENLLSHQRNCNSRSLGKRPGRQTAVIQPSSQPRPSPRTLADLLDRPDDYEGKYSDEPLSRYVQLPSGLEISEIELNRLPVGGVDGSANRKQQASPPAPEADDAESEKSADGAIPLSGEVYPCGHCRKVFETFSRLLKHTAAKHMRNATDGTFHFEIETFMEQ